MTGVDPTTREPAASQRRWPDHGLVTAEPVIVDDDELVVEGRDAAGHASMVSLRDLGEDVSAGFWDDELARLTRLAHPAAAPIVGCRIVDDRYFVIKVRRPPGMLLKTRLLSGALGTTEAGALLIASLDVAAALHGLGLSASGIRLRSAALDTDGDGHPLFVVTTYGLHVDNDIEMFNELREIALRVLALVGGRFDRTDGLVLPVKALTPPLERVLERAVGLVGPPFSDPIEMAAAVAAALGQRHARGDAPRSQVKTRPMAAASQPILGSDLLLAEELLATLPRHGPPS
ncbi:MAG: hypothetical protein IT385_25900 [Deltaproteobacteria bacterium]|nr:hypothetical protein [Deltaproteobacteria bacterium]